LVGVVPILNRRRVWTIALAVLAVVSVPTLRAQATGSAQASSVDSVLQDTTEGDTAQSEATVPGKRHVLRNTPVRYTPVFVWRETAVEAAAFALLAAFLLSIPVALVYRFTTPSGDFDPAIAQSILVLPTAVAGVILVIQGSLALAFSLAGVVTAVRFRSALKDTDDAIYIFLAVAIGVAAGARALDIAVVVCVCVCLALIIVRAPSFLLSRPRIRPGSGAPAGAPAASPDGAYDGAAGDASRAYTVLVHSGDVGKMQPAVEQVLEEFTKDHQLTASGPSSGGVQRLVYSVKLRKRYDSRELEIALNVVATQNGGHADVTTGPASDEHTDSWKVPDGPATGGLP
jgi:hypothetical protein